MNPSEKFIEVLGGFCWNALNEAFHSSGFEPVERRNIGSVYRNRFGDLLLAVGVVHIANVDTVNRNTAFDQTEEIRRRFADQQNFLAIGGTVNIVDHFL